MKASYSVDHKVQLRLLHAVAAIVGKQAGQRGMLGEVLDLLDTQLEMHGGRVVLLSPDGDHMVVESTKTVSSRPTPARSYRNGEDISARVLQTGQALVIPAAAESSRVSEHRHCGAGLSDQRLSFVCLPISLDREVVGTLAGQLFCDDEEMLDQVQQVLSIVAGMIATDALARRAFQCRQRALADENTRLRTALGEQLRPENIVGNSHAMRAVYENIRKVAPTETTVLILGESGTGKELAASAIHYSSGRREKPFVKVNCGSMNEALLESELFGHEAGAITGGVRTRVGRVEQAEGGTLFLDEIGDFTPAMQVKLLRVIQEKAFERVGSNVAGPADIRIVTATSRDLERAVENGDFRQDLYYRINIFPIFLPPLRERKGDILLLADHFVAKYAKQMGEGTTRISTATINIMLAYHWPGNVRELENCMERAALLSNDGVIHGCHLPPTLQVPGGNGQEDICSLKTCIKILERDMIMDALKRCQGNITAASRQLGITARMTRYKIKNLEIDYRSLFKRSHRPADVSGLP